MINYIISKTSLNEVFITNQESHIALSSYYIIKDKINGDLVCEVIDTFSLPKLTESFLNSIDSSLECISDINFDVNKITYIAKVKILKELIYPITPLSEVIEATFEDIKPYVFKTDIDEGFNLGIIKGTELMQSQLPIELQNVSPLWENKRAINQNGIPFILDFNAQREYPHIIITGGSGSGKSVALRDIIEECMRFGLPGIVPDYHYEFEFDKPMPGLDFTPDFKNKYDIYYVGKDIGIPFKDLKLGELITLISHKEPLSDAQKRILDRIFIPGMDINEFIYTLEILAEAFGKMDAFKASENDLTPEEISYYNRFKNYVTSPDTIRTLLSKFLVIEKTGIFTSNIDRVKMSLEQSKFVVIRGNITVVRMIMCFMINRFYESRRYYIDSKISDPNDPKFFPPFFLVLDEAHQFAPKDGTNLPFRDLLRQLGQESRKYGIFLVLCTQGPCLLDKTLLDQMNTKIFLRTTDIANKDIAKNEINLNDTQYKLLPNLVSGCGFIASPILSKTFHIQFRTSFTVQPKSSGIFEELKKRHISNNSTNNLQVIVCNWIASNPDKDSRHLTLLLDEIQKANINLDIKGLLSFLDELESKKIIKIERYGMGKKFKLL